MLTIDQRKSYLVASLFKKRSLLVAVNTLAGISIFFFASHYKHLAIYYLGTLIGCLAGGWFGDKFGRINTIGVGALWSILGASLQCSAQNYTWMLCARVVNGVGTGILNAIVPPWASEIAEHTSRGKFIAIEFTLNIFGVVVACLSMLYRSWTTDDQLSDSRLFAFQLIPLLPLHFCQLVLPRVTQMAVQSRQG